MSFAQNNQPYPMAAHLLGLKDAAQAARDPLRDGLHENLIILEVLKFRLNHGLTPELFFYRDARGNEVDLIIRHREHLISIEIKSAATFTPGFLKGIAHFRKVIGKSCDDGWVLYNGQQQYYIHGDKVVNPLHVTDWMQCTGEKKD